MLATIQVCSKETLAYASLYSKGDFLGRGANELVARVGSPVCGTSRYSCRHLCQGWQQWRGVGGDSGVPVDGPPTAGADCTGESRGKTGSEAAGCDLLVGRSQSI